MPDKQKLVGVQFRIPGAVLEAFTDLAAELGMTKSDLYRAALTEYLKRAKVKVE